MKVISGSPETECAILLSNLIEYWLKSAAEKFPKTAAGLPEAEIQYQKNMQRVQKYNLYAAIEGSIPSCWNIQWNG